MAGELIQNVSERRLGSHAAWHVDKTMISGISRCQGLLSHDV